MTAVEMRLNFKPGPEARWHNILRLVMKNATLADSDLHGDTHWRAVAMTGLRIAEINPAVSPAIALAFGMIHDSKRENDDWDPEHGARAGEFARNLRQLDYVLPEGGRQALETACLFHEKGRTTNDPVIGACWDADRFNLWRVGIAPDPVFFSVIRDEPEFSTLSAEISGRLSAPPSWDELINMTLLAERK